MFRGLDRNSLNKVIAIMIAQLGRLQVRPQTNDLYNKEVNMKA
jgi:hypothetical protein